MRISKGKMGASKDFFDFSACFAPYCAETKEAEKLREEGMIEADPNGNGLCSLAEIETFVLKRLLATYPNTGKGNEFKTPGKDLWTAFRPCYIRAFKDAADYAPDYGETIKGTKNAKQDDFVSKEEFRIFCVYVIVYAAMFDAFSKIDGGGAGRDANDDKRIEKEEWIVGYRNISKYGFVAFEGLDDKKAAGRAWKVMDDNGGGIVLLDEWCWWIKQAEVASCTEVGKLLGADEAGGVGKAEQLASGGKAKVVGKHAEDANSNDGLDGSGSKTSSKKASRGVMSRMRFAGKGTSLDGPLRPKPPPRPKMETPQERKDREAQEAREKFAAREKHTVGEAPHLTAPKTPQAAPRKVETEAQRKDREYREAQEKFAARDKHTKPDALPEALVSPKSSAAPQETAQQREERLWREEREKFAARDKVTNPEKFNIKEDWRDYKPPPDIETAAMREERMQRELARQYAARDKETRPDTPELLRRERELDKTRVRKPPTETHTVSREELEKYMKNNRNVRSEELAQQQAAWEARNEGGEMTTAPEEFGLMERREEYGYHPEIEPTDYSNKMDYNELNKANKNRRDEMSRIADAEADAWAARTGNSRAAKPEAGWDARKNAGKDSLAPLPMLPRDQSGDDNGQDDGDYGSEDYEEEYDE